MTKQEIYNLGYTYNITAFSSSFKDYWEEHISVYYKNVFVAKVQTISNKMTKRDDEIVSEIVIQHVRETKLNQLGI